MYGPRDDTERKQSRVGHPIGKDSAHFQCHPTNTPGKWWLRRQIFRLGWTWQLVCQLECGNFYAARGVFGIVKFVHI
jgi:hypothetical protein